MKFWKTIRKRAAGCLLAVSVALSVFQPGLFQVYAESGNCGESAKWSLENGTLTISGQGTVTRAVWSPYKAKIQSVVVENGITTIPVNAFSGYSELKSVKLADSVTTLNAYFANNCAKLESVSLPKNLSTLPANAFSYCTSLKAIELPSSLVTIGNSAFNGAVGLTEIVIPDQVTTIGASAFYGTNIKTVTLGKSVKELKSNAFGMCCFHEIEIPDSVTTIENGAIGKYYKYVSVSNGKIVGSYDDSPGKTVLIGSPGGAAQTYAQSSGLTFRSNKEHTHVWSEWKEDPPATCETDGKRVRTCSGCGETETEKIAAFGHSWSDWSTAKDPTCTESGVSRRTCPKCGKTEEKEIAATGHSWTDWSTVKNPACTESGVSRRTCPKCGTTEEKEIAATGHSWSEPVYKWSDSHESCTGEISCSRCGDIRQKTVLSSYEVVTSAKVGTPGEGRFTAVFDESPFRTQTVSVEIPALNSQWSKPEYTWSADNLSCTASRKDSVSGEVETVSVKTIYVVKTEAGCVNAGTAEYVARFENTAFEDQVRQVSIPATGHHFGEWKTDVPASCTENGRLSRTCSNCGEKEYSEIPALGHSFGEWKTDSPATCTKEGRMISECERCHEAKYQTIPATGHHFGEWKTDKKPTCTEDGTMIRTCSNCGEVETDSIPATGHDWTAWSVTREATITEQGEERSVCTKCGAIRTKKIPVLTSYAITVSCNEGGSISPDGEFRVAEGGTAIFTIRPENGFHTAAILLDGESVSATNEVRIADVRENHTLSVVFQKDAPVYKRACTAVFVKPNRDIWLSDEKAFAAGDFTASAFISEGGDVVEKDITADCRTNATPESAAAASEKYGSGSVRFTYTGKDSEIAAYFKENEVKTGITVYLRGDCDMDQKISLRDANLALRYYVYNFIQSEETVFNDLQKVIADVNNSGKADQRDARYILCYYTYRFIHLDPTWDEIIHVK
ncbi:MAG: leucine-rich repeat protein [Oscillospiraceae bacterium]|nr:leucine-rich repeat protein [Oscillospiraceae bacterium]